MHGSTSPSKNDLDGMSRNSSSHWKPASRRATALSTAGSVRSTPVARSRSIVKRVGSHTGAPARCHEPSDPWRARISAPTPSRGTRERSAATAAGEAPVRSRIACQLIAGSESSSQSMGSTPVYYLFNRCPGWTQGTKRTGLISDRAVTSDPRLRSETWGTLLNFPIRPGLGFPVLSDSRQTAARRPQYQSTRVLAALPRRG